MTKQEFLSALRKRLSKLPKQETEERLAFYSEIIDDRIEEGSTERDAVQSLGTVEEIASQIIAEIPLTKIVKERIKPKRRLNALEIVLLVLGSPIWLSLGIAAFAVLVSVYAVLWSVVISLWWQVSVLPLAGMLFRALPCWERELSARVLQSCCSSGAWLRSREPLF